MDMPPAAAEHVITITAEDTPASILVDLDVTPVMYNPEIFVYNRTIATVRRARRCARDRGPMELVCAEIPTLVICIVFADLKYIEI
jgi:hypothetical protein